ncbi:MAG: hypothetical protein U0R19_38335 [Bryobacteraceae bacterium]
MPTFATEQAEADWWASKAGREFLTSRASGTKLKKPAGSKIVAKLASSHSVQIALRLPSPDIAKAREIAERKGIGYQTLLKMIVHEGLRRVDRQS